MYYVKLGAILLIICAIAAGLLAYINGLTEPIIKERKAKEEIQTREALIPGATFIADKTASGLDFFIAQDPQTNEVIGYTFIAAKNGYSGEIQTMVGLDKEFKILNIKVINQSETPGLGANCTLEGFAKLFVGLSDTELLVDKDGGKIPAMAGATITTRAITNSIKEQVIALKNHLANAPQALAKSSEEVN